MIQLSQGERRLAAIMFTDMVDYTTMSEKNEALALALLEEHRTLLQGMDLANLARLASVCWGW